MAINAKTETDFTLTLSAEERTALLRFLEEGLRTKNIEANRTDAIKYREFVHHEEEILQQLIEKVRRK